MDRHGIAAILEEIAQLLELKGENSFKVQAYRTGARRLEEMTEDFTEVMKEERISELPGIGKALAEKIETLYRTGKLPYYRELRKEIPKGLVEMLKISGLGAKRIKEIYETLGIKTVSGLKKACEKGKIAELDGFGEKSEENILQGIRNLEAYSKRFLWWEGMAAAQPILKELRKHADAAEIAGSLRRKRGTIHDIDFLAASDQPQKLMDWFTSQDFVSRVTAKGTTKASVRLKEGMQADLRVVPKEQFAFALHYFTGSKNHNIQMRKRAHEFGYRLSEWGLEPLDNQKPVKAPTESKLFQALGLSYIPPELREDRGEMEAAEKGELPHLVTEKEIRGVFHNHTTASDGHSTLEEMAKAAEKLGWEYLGISDHSKSSVQANGLSEEALLAQVEEIRKLNRSEKSKIHLFAGTECDILKDGSLDYNREILEKLDYVVISVHSSFQMPEKEMTRRIIRAIEHPCTTMLGHPTGRLLLRREPYSVNLPKIIDACAANGVIIEINSNPRRLDLDWRFWPLAKEKGVLCSINPDAHSTEMLKFYLAGVNVARKGWLEAKDILNTRPLSEVKKRLKR